MQQVRRLRQAVEEALKEYLGEARANRETDGSSDAPPLEIPFPFRLSFYKKGIYRVFLLAATSS